MIWNHRIGEVVHKKEEFKDLYGTVITCSQYSGKLRVLWADGTLESGDGEWLESFIITEDVMPEVEEIYAKLKRKKLVSELFGNKKK